MESEDYFPSQGLEEDPLIFIYDYTFIKSWSNKYVKLIVLFCVAHPLLFALIGVYQMFIAESLPYRIYITNLVLLFETVFIGAFLYLIRNWILSYTKIINLQGWSLRSAGEATFIEIKKECQRLKRAIIFWMLLPITSLILQIIPTGDEEEWHVVFVILKSHFSGKMLQFHIILYSTIECFYGLILMSSIVFGQYIMFHITFQYRILNKYLEKIIVHNGEIDDITYQKRIKNKLKLSVIIHQQIIRVTNQLLKDFPLITIAFILTAWCFCIFPVYFILAKINPNNNFRMIVLLVTWVAYLPDGGIFCQKITDESANVYSNVLRCPWSDWNVENRKLFIMLIINTANPVVTSKYGVPSIDYKFILMVCRTCYGVIMFFIKITG